jgi:hypothetical protein
MLTFKTKKEILDRVGAVITRLGGHLHGDYVLNHVLLGGSEVLSIDCTISRATFHRTVDMLELDMKVVPIAGEPHSYSVGDEEIRLRLMPYTPGFDPVPDALPLFDIDSFSMNKRSIYSDETDVSSLLSRVREKKFTLHKSLTSKSDADALVRAQTLVRNGWNMDGGPWTVSILSEDLPDTQCAICFDFFCKGQTVAKLSCGHIFHVRCNNAEKTSGLHGWFVLGKPECPCCRKAVRCNF